MSELYKEWFQKAEEDESTIKIILQEKEQGGAPGVVCFHCQQMAEKYLKGFLVVNNSPFKKIHDLLELESAILEFNSDIKDFHAELESLNRYYVRTRYPTDSPEFFWDDAEEAYQAAKRIKEFILSNIPDINAGVARKNY